MKVAALLLSVVALAGVVLAIGGCHTWKFNQTVDGVRYERIRFESHTQDDEIEEFSIGYLHEPVELDGRMYQKWLHRRTNGTIRGGLLSAAATIDGIDVPAESWVSFDSEGRLKGCNLPANQTIQGHLVRGTGGGSKGAVVSFYPGGKLRLFFAPEDTNVDGIPCDASLFHAVQLHENGRLKACVLASDASVDGRALSEGTAIVLNDEGKLLSTK